MMIALDMNYSSHCCGSTVSADSLPTNPDTFQRLGIVEGNGCEIERKRDKAVL